MLKKIKESLILFLLFFKISLFTFGGGLAMLAIIEREFVNKRNYLTAEELMDMIAISESTPGPLAINMATYIGSRRTGFIGALLATFGVVLPSFIIILIISLFLKDLMEYEYVKAAFSGINCAVGLLIFIAGLSLFKTLPKKPWTLVMFGLTLAGYFTIVYFSFNFSPVFLILIGASVGLTIEVFKRHTGNKEVETK